MNHPIPTSRKNITAILVEAGAVTSDQIGVALVRQRETGRRIGETLVELGFVSEEDIGWALAHQLGIPFVDVRPDTLDLELVRSFPEGALRRLQAVPLFRAEGVVTVAVADPTDADTVRELERLCEGVPACVAATPSAIESALDAVLGRRPGARTRERGNEAPFEVVWDRSGESFLAFHLKWARRLGAAEVHFVCAGGWLHVMHRSAPRVSTLGREPAAVMDVLLARFESLGMAPLTSGEGHRHFRASCDVAGVEQDFAASVLVTREGRSATLRLLRERSERPRIESLGLEPLDVAQLRERLAEPSGLVLVAGPPHAGVTTTLQALLAETAAEDQRWAVFARERGRWPAPVNVIERIEGELSARWRRIAVAHSLDGAVVDGGLEGARVRHAIGAAAQGRWLFARTDWEDTFELLAWLARAPRGRAALAQRLRAVVQQRLVATPRANAAPQAAETPEESTNGSATPAEPLRRAVFEVLFPSDALREGILAGADAPTLRAIALQHGFHPLAECLRAGVQRGRLDPRDSNRAVA